ncbi:hypothetical protein D6817_05325 [Candidatus Pacearchaeota archaeon]|nr:MAG: hypothetical protein D6817_05325 [Candidatus Pacearchaeota archaeon]
MVPLQNPVLVKEKIIAFIRQHGPSLPVQIARELKMQPLFVSAFLSELRSEGKIKMSHMHVGSSPLYFLRGQEHMLENFTSFLNQREREALAMLKSNKVLEDSKLSPVARVALRNLPDFALAFDLRSGSEVKTFWRYFLCPESEARAIVQSAISASTKETAPPELSSRTEKEPTAKTAQTQVLLKTEPKSLAPHSPPQKRKTKKQKQDSEFVEKVKDYLRGQDIELLETYSSKKRELEARVRIDMQFGKQEYLLVAKNRKKITDNDLSLALQKATNLKMPALVLSNGTLTNKAREYLRNWNNLVKFEKIKYLE